jgi:hypothetical protein
VKVATMTHQSTKRGLEETSEQAVATVFETATMMEVVPVTAKKTTLMLMLTMAH